MRDQPVEAGPEHDRRDDGEDRDRAAGQVGSHGGLAGTGGRLQREADAEGDHTGHAGGGGGPGHSRGRWHAPRIEVGPYPIPGHRGQQAHQRHPQDQGAARQHRRIELGPTYGVELPHGLQGRQG